MIVYHVLLAVRQQQAFRALTPLQFLENKMLDKIRKTHHVRRALLVVQNISFTDEKRT